MRTWSVIAAIQPTVLELAARDIVPRVKPLTGVDWALMISFIEESTESNLGDQTVLLARKSLRAEMMWAYEGQQVAVVTPVMMFANTVV